MVFRFYGAYGELLRVKLWTKTGEKELSYAVELEHHPVTNELLAIVRCAIVVKVPAGPLKTKSGFTEQEYLISVAEKYASLLTPEEFKKQKKEIKSNIVENIKNNYKTISRGTRSIWKWD